MKLVVTIFEPSGEAAIAAIGGLRQEHDAIELRLDAQKPGFGPAIDFAAVRAATPKPIIVTNRGGAPADFAAAYAAGIDFVDVEFGRDPGPRRDRVVLSHHDYDGAGDVEGLARAMRAEGCAHTKLAVTPQTFDENARLLAAVAPGMTVIGMGERGLYARIAAPFFGSELQFVAVDGARVAAPGQLTLADALAIYGSDRARLHAEQLFAIAGSPAAHSRSPLIHNARFRERGVPGAYTIASFATFAEIAEPFGRGDRFAPVGLSVTAPFKEEALHFARRRGGEIGANAVEAGAANTLVRLRGRIVADNTDVDGFAALLGATRAKRAGVVGAGATARAAGVALARRGIPFLAYNRTPRPGAEPLAALARFDGDLLIDTLPPGTGVALPLRPGMTLIEAAYGAGRSAVPEGVTLFDGLDLLQAQAKRQSELFLEVFR